MFIQRWGKSWPRTPTSTCTMARPKSGTEVAVEPSGMEEIARAARVVKPDAVVWRGDPLLPNFSSVNVLNTEYVREFLERKTREQ